MNAFFFGPPDKHLFGYHHAPNGEGRGNVLLCQPWGPEYQFAHRTMRFLAKRLSDSGWHVLRFDYSGTGDSWGASTQADLDEWPRDVDLAAEELQAVSGLPGLNLIGLRLGAYVAAASASRRGDTGALVLWDPVTDGREWIDELVALSGHPKVPLDDGAGVEFGKQAVSHEFVRQVEHIDLTGLGLKQGQPALQLETQPPKPEAGASPENEATKVVRLSQPAPWIEDVSTGSGEIPVMAVKTIVDWVGAS